MGKLVRQSGGVYKDSETGKVYKGVSAEDLPALQKKVGGATAKAPSGGGGQASSDPRAGFAPQGKIPKGVDAKEASASEYGAQKALQYGNVNQQGPFGSRKFSFDAQGNPIQTDTLDAGQQAIYERDTTLSRMGRDLAQQQLGSGQFNQPFMADQNLGADRMRIEDDVFNRLTRNSDRDFQKEQERLGQTLANRGIPVGSQLYNDQMRQLGERRDAFMTDARQRATEIGGTEFGRSFDIGRQTRQQQLGELGGFAQFGQGLQVPQFQGFQGAPYQQTSPLEYDLAKQELAIRRQAAGRSGGGGAAPAQANPFNNSPFPGT